jgi:hypothetical protein
VKRSEISQSIVISTYVDNSVIYNDTIKAAELIHRATRREGDYYGVREGIGKDAIVPTSRYCPAIRLQGQNIHEKACTRCRI